LNIEERGFRLSRFQVVKVSGFKGFRFQVGFALGHFGNPSPQNVKKGRFQVSWFQVRTASIFVRRD